MKRVLGKTIEKFYNLVEEGKKPDWNYASCPLCIKFRREHNCGDCSFRQFSREGCLHFARDLDVEWNSYEILQMLGQIYFHLYGKLYGEE